MSRQRAAALSGALLVMCAAAPHETVAGASAARSATGLDVSDQPPPFSAVDLSGEQHTLQDYLGSVLVLHFWASWCPYCRGEIPKLKTLHEQWASKGVRVLTVSVDEDPAQLRRFVAKAALPYPVVADGEANFSVSDRYGIDGIPVTYVVGRDGQIASALPGRADIIGAVQRALER